VVGAAALVGATDGQLHRANCSIATVRWPRKLLPGAVVACVTAGAAAVVAVLIAHKPNVSPPAPRRITIPSDPVPSVARLPAAVAQLICSANDYACAGEAADAVTDLKASISVPAVDTNALIARCGRLAEAAAVAGRGVAAFEGCLRAGRERTLWLPGPGFRMPQAGWFAFYQRDDSGCGDRVGRCTILGLVDLTDGTAAVSRTTEPAAGDRAPARVERFIGTAPLRKARGTALIAILSPHVALPQIAITAEVPAELVATEIVSATDAPIPDRFVQMALNKKRDYRWAWLSSTGEALATSSFQAAPLSGPLAGRMAELPGLIRPGCPKRNPLPDDAKIDDALGGTPAGAFAALRAALAACPAAGR